MMQNIPPDRFVYLIVVLPDGRIMLQKNITGRSSFIFNSTWRATIIVNNMYKCQSDITSACNVFYTFSGFKLVHSNSTINPLGEFNYLDGSLQVFLARIKTQAQFRCDCQTTVKAVSFEKLVRDISNTQTGLQYTMDTIKCFNIPDVIFNTKIECSKRL